MTNTTQNTVETWSPAALAGANAIGSLTQIVEIMSENRKVFTVDAELEAALKSVQTDFYLGIIAKDRGVTLAEAARRLTLDGFEHKTSTAKRDAATEAAYSSGKALWSIARGRAGLPKLGKGGGGKGSGKGADKSAPVVDAPEGVILSTKDVLDLFKTLSQRMNDVIGANRVRLVGACGERLQVCATDMAQNVEDAEKALATDNAPAETTEHDELVALRAQLAALQSKPAKSKPAKAKSADTAKAA